MRWRIGLLIGYLIGGIACGATTPSKTETTPSKKNSESNTATASSSDANDQIERPSVMPSAQPMGKSKEATGINETSTVTPGQCEDLEQTLTRLIYADLSAKIPAKITPEERSREEKESLDVAKKTAAQFGDSCRRSMVGNEIKRETLECMFKAKTFQIFDACTH